MEGKRPEIRFKGYDDEWVSKRFGDAFDFISNNTLSRDNLNNESGAALNVHYGDVLIKFGEYLDVQKEQLPFISDEALVNKFQTSLLRDGDVIIADTAEDTTVGKCTEIVCVDGKKIISGLHTMACRPKDKYTLRFLGYCLNSPKYHKNLLPLMQGVKVLSISKSGISDTNIVISENRDEQGKIANFLAALDREIKAELLKCEKLAILKKAMLKKMFPVGERKVPEIRFDGYTDDWEQRKLGDISDIKTGPFGSTLHADDYVSDGIPIITTEHFKTGTLPIKKDGLPQVSENDFNRLSAYILNEGDIVFSRVGSVDINALITPFQNNWLFSGRVLRVRPQGENSSQLLHTLLETESVRSDIRTRAVGQTMPSINTEILKITPLFLPTSIAEQERLGEYFHNLDHLITLHQCKLERLKNIKSACIKKMFV